MFNVRFFMILFVVATPSFGQDAGWIGVRVADQPDRGVLIRAVEPNSAAAKAGLKSEDVIVTFDKQDVIGVVQFARLVRETPVGRVVEVKVQRDNREETFQVTTERAPKTPVGIDLSDLRDRIMRQMPDIRPSISVSQYGIRVDSLTPQLREFFGVGANEGVLVASVETDSAAAKAGLKSGDVITAVDAKRISTPQDFSHEMRSAGSTVTLTIVRDKQEREIQIEGVARRPTGPRRERINSSEVNVL